MSDRVGMGTAPAFANELLMLSSCPSIPLQQYILFSFLLLHTCVLYATMPMVSEGYQIANVKCLIDTSLYAVLYVHSRARNQTGVNRLLIAVTLFQIRK